MKTKTETVRNLTQQLRLTGIGTALDELLMNGQQNQSSHLDFTLNLLEAEIAHRNKQKLLRRLKNAKLPANSDLDNWEHNRQNGLAKQQMEQLRECVWLEQNFNILLMGPSGTGKTRIATGLCHEALQKGYNAFFRTMEQIIYIIKMKDITKSAALEYAYILKANLLVIDDIMMFPIEKKHSVALFNLINHLHQNAAMIVTTNKSPEEWAAMLDDEVLATAILDRLLYNCEIVKLTGKSYRLDNRKTIFKKTAH